MKIGFLISSTGWGGLEMNTLLLAQALSEKGFQITLFTIEESTINKKVKGEFESVFAFKKIRKYFDFSIARKIAKRLESNNIQTLLVFDNKDLDVASWCKRLFYKNLTIIYQQHMQIGINKKGLLHTFRFDAINWWITPLHYLKREVIERTNFPVHKIKVIPIGLNVEYFSSPKYTKREALKLLGINPQGTLLGIIGRVSEKKGQLFILEAVQQLRAMGHKLELLIFGSPTINDPESLVYYEKLLKKTDSEDLKDVIHFIPHKEDVLLFYNAIDIFTLASHSETYGMVTIEAMLSKIPIIATKSGGTSEILEDEALGFLYHYGNMGEFCEKLIELENSPAKSKLKVENAFETAKETYAKEKEVDAISEVISNW